MDNHYTEAAFTIPCTADQAHTAMHALAHIDGEVSDFAMGVIAKDDATGFSPKEIIIRHCLINHPNRIVDEITGEVDHSYCTDWCFALELCEGGIFITAAESIDTKHAAIFTQAILKAYNSPFLVAISAAHTCIKPREDGFGGHACTVTKEHIHWMDMSGFIDAEITAHEACAQHYLAKIYWPANSKVLTCTYLIQCNKGEDPLDRIKNQIELPSVGADIKKITPFEFRIMKGHLNPL